MTYHRTTGKGGTVNRGRDNPYPNFNKSTVDGNKAPPRQGRRKPPNMRMPSGPSRNRGNP